MSADESAEALCEQGSLMLREELDSLSSADQRLQMIRFTKELSTTFTQLGDPFVAAVLTMARARLGDEISVAEELPLEAALKSATTA